ncbi:MAG: RsiV family protein [Rikenellaceae bacterium]
MVKKIVLAILCVASLVGCKSDDNRIYWEILSEIRNFSDFKANMSYAYRFGGDTTASNNINNIINTVLVEPLVDRDSYITIDSLLNFMYAEKSADSVINRTYYELNSSASVYEYERFTSVMVFSYYYTGGANGIAQTAYLNFNSESGDYIPIGEIILLDETLLLELRRKFCIVREVPINATAQEVGMFVSPNELAFPEQIGFSSQGVVFFYNLYEIGPRAIGTTEVIIPYEDVKFIVM